MDKDDVKFAGGLVLIGVLLFVVLFRGIQEVMIPGELASVEQLREDVKRVEPGENEDVMGQVIQWNQKIKSAQRYRKVWWGRICTPEEWDSVNIIEIPQH